MKAAGITVVGHSIKIVVISGTQPYACDNERTFALQGGDRSRAYSVIQGQIKDFLHHLQIKIVALKASASSGRGGATDSLLGSAELRGVVQVAIIEAGCEIEVLKKASVSRLGSKKIDDYVGDDDFWNDNLPQLKNKGMREAAFFAIKAIEQCP